MSIRANPEEFFYKASHKCSLGGRSFSSDSKPRLFNQPLWHSHSWLCSFLTLLFLPRRAFHKCSLGGRSFSSDMNGEENRPLPESTHLGAPHLPKASAGIPCCPHGSQITRVPHVSGLHVGFCLCRRM